MGIVRSLDIEKHLLAPASVLFMRTAGGLRSIILSKLVYRDMVYQQAAHSADTLRENSVAHVEL